MTTELKILPRYIQWEIFSYLPPHERGKLSIICKDWKSLINHKLAWPELKEAFDFSKTETLENFLKSPCVLISQQKTLEKIKDFFDIHSRGISKFECSFPLQRNNSIILWRERSQNQEIKINTEQKTDEFKKYFFIKKLIKPRFIKKPNETRREILYLDQFNCLGAHTTSEKGTQGELKKIGEIFKISGHLTHHFNTKEKNSLLISIFKIKNEIRRRKRKFEDYSIPK